MKSTIIKLALIIISLSYSMIIQAAREVIINEIAWMGTTTSANDEWIELKNTTGADIDLSGWTLSAQDGTPNIFLTGSIIAGSFFMLERTDDTTLSSTVADAIYTGAMENGGEDLELRDSAGVLIDSVDAWYTGDNTSKATMERSDSAQAGTLASNWNASISTYAEGIGTPATFNSQTDPNGPSGGMVINELAWMGTTVSANDEWIELFNNTSADIDLNGWTLSAQDGTPNIALSGIVIAGGFFMLERTDDTTLSGLVADLIYTGAMGNTGDIMELRDGSGALVDAVDAWYAGDNTAKASMERIDSAESGTLSTNWSDGSEPYTEGLGTPGAVNTQSNPVDEIDPGTPPPPPPGGTQLPEGLNTFSDALGAINIFFNKSVLTEYATAGNLANENVNLENRNIARIDAARSKIDIAAYEINLTGMVKALINSAAAGVTVRMLVDAKKVSDAGRIARFELMRLNLEKLARGLDGVIGTADDVHLFADSAIFAVEDSTARTHIGLPADANDIAQVTVKVGSSNETGRLFIDAEKKSSGDYYSPGNQMHNKFLVIDDKWVLTGSWNYTTTGLYGTDADEAVGLLKGNTQVAAELHSPELAAIYTVEFNEMWGASSLTPDPELSNFHGRKSDNTAHLLTVGGRSVEVYFSPGDDAIGKVTEYIAQNADINAYFSIFAWSDQALVDELKFKYEGSRQDLVGTVTGFDVKGVFDSSFWNLWWSASVEMRGLTVNGSTNNPNIRWANQPPIFIANEDRKMHAKTMLIDADTASDPSVIMGSTNWSNNGNAVNDENLLIIHDAAITNQFLQEFYARYSAAGGTIPLP